MRAVLYKIRNFFAVESGGPRAIVGALLRNTIAAAIAAYAKSLDHSGPEFSFDWSLFWWLLVGIVAGNVLSNVFDVYLKGGQLLRPVNGRMFRSDRKKLAAATLKAISLDLPKAPAPPEARKLVGKILDCIASHVRDARGSHDAAKLEVFANFLVEDNDDLVVVARDSDLHSSVHKRVVPMRYKKSSMLAARTIAAKRVLSVGDLRLEYPEAPRNKPYRSILTIPVIGRDDEVILGVVSVDCSRPYFFQSFQQGVIENELENDLLPYLQTLALVLEGLVSGDRHAIVAALIADANATPPRGN